MSARSIAEVLLAVLGIFFVGSAIPNLTTAIFLLVNDSQAADSPLSLFSLIGSFAAQVATGAALLFFRRHVATGLFRNADGESSLDVASLQAVGFSLLGAYFVVKGVSESARYLFIASRDFSSYLTLGSGSAAQIVLGLLLFFGKPGLLSLWRSARNAGRGSRAA